MTNLNIKNGQNTELNNQNVEFGGPLRSQQMAKNEFIHGNNELYVQEYRDITLNTKLGKNKDIIRQKVW